MTHPDLDGKAAIVTGAGAGIGLAIAQRLAAEGAKVLCADIDGAAADAAAATIGGGAVGHRVDVSDERQVIAMVDACVTCLRRCRQARRQCGRRAFRVRSPRRPSKTSTGSSRSTCAVHGCAPSMRRRRMIERGGGAIVNMSSLAGHVAAAGTAAYGMSKAGIIHLSRVTAAEFRSANVRSNALLPAFVDTPMQQAAMTMFDEALGEGGGRHDDRPTPGPDGRIRRRWRPLWPSCFRTTPRWSTAPRSSPTAGPSRPVVNRLMSIDSAMAVISSPTPAYRVRCHVRATSSMKLSAAATSSSRLGNGGLRDQLADEVDPLRLRGRPGSS